MPGSLGLLPWHRVDGNGGETHDMFGFRPRCPGINQYVENVHREYRLREASQAALAAEVICTVIPGHPGGPPHA
jgi:hypothetical protein